MMGIHLPGLNVWPEPQTCDAWPEQDFMATHRSLLQHTGEGGLWPLTAGPLLYQKLTALSC